MHDASSISITLMLYNLRSNILIFLLI